MKTVIHHSAYSYKRIDNQFDLINDWHKNRIWGKDMNGDDIYCNESDLGFYSQYHYIIERNGDIRKPRQDYEPAWHSGSFAVNMNSIAICLVGNFEISEPTTAQLRSLVLVLKGLKKKHKSIEILGHKDVKPTACPGRNLYNKLPQIKQILSVHKNSWWWIWTRKFLDLIK